MLGFDETGEDGESETDRTHVSQLLLKGVLAAVKAKIISDDEAEDLNFIGEVDGVTRGGGLILVGVEAMFEGVAVAGLTTARTRRGCVSHGGSIHRIGK